MNLTDALQNDLRDLFPGNTEDLFDALAPGAAEYWRDLDPALAAIPDDSHVGRYARAVVAACETVAAALHQAHGDRNAVRVADVRSMAKDAIDVAYFG